jgi:transcriptional regulator with XRE-family HTH domain
MSVTSNNLKFLRKKFGYTQERFAEAVGIKRSSLGAYEEGRADVRPDVLDAMAALFGVTASDLKNTDLTNVIGAVPPTPRIEPPRIERSFTQPVQPPLPPKLDFTNSIEGGLFSSLPPVLNSPAPEKEEVNPVFTPTPNPVVEELTREKIVANKVESDHQNTTQSSPKKPAQKIDADYLSGRECRYLAYTANENGKPLLNMVSKDLGKDYIKHISDVHFLSKLETLSFPWAETDGFYRAFELPTENQFWVIGKFCRNWIQLQQFSHHLVVTVKGIFYGNLVSFSLETGLALENEGKEISLSWDSILEVWIQAGVISQTKPAENTALQRILGKLNDLQTEILDLTKQG